MLEIGFGSGLNLPYYNGTVEEIIAVDSSPGMLALHRRGDLVAVQHDSMWDGHSWRRAEFCGLAVTCGSSNTGCHRIPRWGFGSIV